MRRTIFATVAILALFALLSPPAAAGQSLFAPAVNYPVAGSPYSIAVGDFNDDGVLDLAVADGVVGDVGELDILLGNPDGTFQAPVSYTVSPVAAVATGDFNGDGKLDLVLADEAGLSILLGNGDGTFQPAADFGVGSGTATVALVVADFNRDGKLDVALANGEGGAQNAGNVSVLLGNGDGTFQPAVNYSAEKGPNSIAAGDLNGDGALDLAVVNERSNSVSVLLGNGSGGFEKPVNYNAGDVPFAVAIADLNGDGALDLVVTRNSQSAKVGLLFGNGDGTFGKVASYAAGGDAQRGVAVADLNGDGALDIVLASDSSISGPTSVLLGKGRGAFQAPLTFAVGSSPMPVVLGDFNGDGRLDVAVGNVNYPFSSVSILLNAGALPAVTLSPSSLTFTAQLVGTTSAGQNVTLTNTGIAPLTISSFTVAGDFLQSNTCGGTVGLGASCTIYVSFQPKARGTRTGSVSIVDNASNSPQVITLAGTGDVVKLAPTSLDFGSVAVGTSSQPQAVTLTNLGKATLTITSITKDGANPGDFTETDNCGSTVLSGASCTINITFTPTATGSRSALVVVFDNGGGTDQTASLSGTGT